MTTAAYNLEQTAKAISITWEIAHESEADGDFKAAYDEWQEVWTLLAGMWKMANWVLGCKETKEFISELKYIALSHKYRVFNLK